MSEEGVYVLAAGLACPVGLRCRSAATAIRAGISRFGEVEGVLDGAGDPVRASYLNTLSSTLSRTARSIFFARHALSEALAGLNSPRPRTMPLFLALPEQGPVSEQGELLHPTPLVDALIDVAAQAPGPIGLSYHPERCFPQGRAGFFHALQAAITTLKRGESDLAVIGAADSMSHEGVLRALLRDNRLLGEANQDGILPGEAGAFILLAFAHSSLARHAIARVEASALIRQPAFLRGGPLDASGLTSLLATLRLRYPGRVDTIFSAQPSEGLWARQFAVAHLRNTLIVPEPLRHTPVGDALGDLGAAAGAVAAVQAIEALAAPISTKALIYGLGEHGFVGGAVLTATPRSESWGRSSTWQFHRGRGTP